MSLPKNKNFVCPNQKSIDLQKDAKEGYSVCTKCLKEKKQKEFARKNWYLCKKCHSAYSKKRAKKVSYNQLW